MADGVVAKNRYCEESECLTTLLDGETICPQCGSDRIREDSFDIGPETEHTLRMCTETPPAVTL